MINHFLRSELISKDHLSYILLLKIRYVPD